MAWVCEVQVNVAAADGLGEWDPSHGVHMVCQENVTSISSYGVQDGTGTDMSY